MTRVYVYDRRLVCKVIYVKRITIYGTLFVAVVYMRLVKTSKLMFIVFFTDFLVNIHDQTF